MSRVRYRKAKDGNHNELRDYALGLGFGVLETHVLNGGLDLLVGFAGQDVRVEIKDSSLSRSRRKLSEGEESVFKHWPGRKPILWSSKADVDATRKLMLRQCLMRGDLRSH